jgi:hypothetical protein
MSDKDALFVLVAPYENVEAAVADCDAMRALYARSRPAHGLDAAVVERDVYGQVLLVDDCEANQMEMGLAIGIASALFPPIGVGAALAAGPGGGDAVGAIVRHVRRDIAREEFEQLAEMLEAAEAGLIAVYEASVAEQVEATISSDSYTIIRASDVDAHQLVRDAGSVTGATITKK